MSATTRQKIRVLFVSGATGGGSLLSTRQLAFELRDRGYSVGFLEQTRRVDCRRRRWVHEKLRTLAVKVRPRSLSRPVVAMAGMIGSWPKPSENIDGVDCWKSAIVGNAVGRVINKLHPDVVVVAALPHRAGLVRTPAPRSGVSPRCDIYVRRQACKVWALRPSPMC